MRCLTLTYSLVALGALLGCERTTDSAPEGKAAPAPPSVKDEHDHKSGDSPSQKNEGDRTGHSGEVVELGSAVIDAFNVRASRDKVEFKAGGDAPVDVWIDGGVGQGVTAVRFWIGVQDAKGSIKAKAAIEDGKWHTHVEIPSPLPEGSKLWVEVETSGGKKSPGSFDLKI